MTDSDNQSHAEVFGDTEKQVFSTQEAAEYLEISVIDFVEKVFGSLIKSNFTKMPSFNLSELKEVKSIIKANNA